MGALIGSGKIADGLVFTSIQTLYTAQINVSGRSRKTLIAKASTAQVVMSLQVLEGGVWMDVSDVTVAVPTTKQMTLDIAIAAGIVRFKCVSAATATLDAWLNSEPISN